MRMLPLSATGGAFTTLYLIFICSLCVTVDVKEHQEQKPDTVERQYIDLSSDVAFNFDDLETKENGQDKPDTSQSAARKEENGVKGNSHIKALVNLTVQVDLTKYTNSSNNNNRIRRSANTWLRLLKGFKKSDDDDDDLVSDRAAYTAEQDDDLPRPILVSLPVGRDSLAPMLILPIPVPTDSSTKCSAAESEVSGEVSGQLSSSPLTSINRTATFRSKPPVPPGIGSKPIMFYPYAYAVPQAGSVSTQSSSQISYGGGSGAVSMGGVQKGNQFRAQRPVLPFVPGQYTAGLGTGQISGQNSQISQGQMSTGYGISQGGANKYQVNQGQNSGVIKTETPNIRPDKRPLPVGKNPNKSWFDVAPQFNQRNFTQSGNPTPQYPTPNSPNSFQNIDSKETFERTPKPPQMKTTVSSQKLVELFKKQTSPRFTRSLKSMDTYPAVPENRKVRQAQSPPGITPPRLEGSFMLRGVLTVPGSRFTEPYVAWWDEVTTSARIDMHDGATSSYLTTQPDGRVQYSLTGTTRVGYSDQRYCGEMVPRDIQPDDYMTPVFPNMENFTLDDSFDDEFGGRIERWTNLVSGRPGELGAARGESLSFFHEVVLARSPNKPNINPLRYSVNVTSSVLGHSDFYFHQYTDLVEITPNPLVMKLHIDDVCSYKANLSSSSPLVDPLREFFLPHRHEKYTENFNRFKKTYQRQYDDDVEEAVRKTQFILHSRFIYSGNRRSDHFYMEMNHFGDRLDQEMAIIQKDVSKVDDSFSDVKAAPFFYSSQDLEDLRNNLPLEYDWRNQSAVTNLREKGDCIGSWAIAVTEAMEGAYFLASNFLEKIDENWINACADPASHSECQPNWPTTAYRYLQNQGVPRKGSYFSKGDCRNPPEFGVKRISYFVNVTSNSILALKVAIIQNGPTVVLLSTSSDMLTFVGKRGVFYDDNCPKDKPEYAMLAVGWGEFRGDTYFILKNSWSNTWGHDGYIRVGAGPNTCGILSYPTYIEMNPEDKYL